jgi:hypothetical protein
LNAHPAANDQNPKHATPIPAHKSLLVFTTRMAASNQANNHTTAMIVQMSTIEPTVLIDALIDLVDRRTG